MSLATLVGSKVSVIEATGTTTIQFPSLETALSALVKHKWVLVTALENNTVLFQHESDDALQCISQLQLAARLVESVVARRAVARLSAAPDSKT
ncbi:MAG: hypothetical protein IT324_26375 [Anaerolineae bacterium]|nr:hypothetical protein [Anaerolineae bacterium]